MPSNSRIDTGRAEYQPSPSQKAVEGDPRSCNLNFTWLEVPRDAREHGKRIFNSKTYIITYLVLAALLWIQGIKGLQVCRGCVVSLVFTAHLLTCAFSAELLVVVNAPRPFVSL